MSTIHQPIPDEFLHIAVATSFRLPARVWRGIMAGMLATAPAPQLGNLEVPALVLSGDRDAVFLAPARRDLLAQLPNARAIFYPERGHAPHWERPQAFATDLIAFLPTAADIRLGRPVDRNRNPA